MTQISGRARLYIPTLRRNQLRTLFDYVRFCFVFFLARGRSFAHCWRPTEPPGDGVLSNHVRSLAAGSFRTNLPLGVVRRLQSDTGKANVKSGT